MDSVDFLGPFLQAIPVTLSIYWKAFLVNPWPWLLVLGLLVTGAVLSRRRSRRRN